MSGTPGDRLIPSADAEVVNGADRSVDDATSANTPLERGTDMAGLSRRPALTPAEVVEFEDFVIQYRQRLWGRALYLNGAPDLAEEVFQEALVRAFERWPQLLEMDDRRRFGWVMTAMQHVSRELIRVKTRAQLTDTVEEISDRFHKDDGQSEAPARTVEAVMDLLPLIERLPERQRMVMLMKIDGFTYNEIAERLQISTATVRATQMHARRKLLREDGVRRWLS
jgi:RNA polymerase sigma-70 factor (ECF subfamily)